MNKPGDFFDFEGALGGSSIDEPTKEEFEEPTAREASVANRTFDRSAVESSIGDGVPEIPNYEIATVLGQGTSAVVYRARHVLLNRSVAIKVFFAPESRKVRARFLREAEALARADHPNLVRVWDVGFTRQDEPFLVLELADGPSLTEVIARRTLTQLRALSIFRQIAAGVQELHRLGIIHRDLKPKNVVISKGDDRVRIVDFGLSRFDDARTRLTAPGALIGTPLSMAPEQLLGKEASAKADVYAVGVIAHWMLSGEPPFTGNIEQLRVAKAQRPQLLNHPLGTLIQRMLDPDPTLRPTMNEVVAALQESPREAAPEPSPRPKTGVWAGVMFLVGCGMGSLFTSFGRPQREGVVSRPPSAPVLLSASADAASSQGNSADAAPTIVDSGVFDVGPSDSGASELDAGRLSPDSAVRRVTSQPAPPLVPRSQFERQLSEVLQGRALEWADLADLGGPVTTYVGSPNDGAVREAMLKAAAAPIPRSLVDGRFARLRSKIEKAGLDLDRAEEAERTFVALRKESLEPGADFVGLLKRIRRLEASVSGP